MLAVIAGLAAGSIHVLSGPDHLAAISPLAVQSRVRTWLIGLRWGIGHTAGVALVGLLALGLREIIPIDFISSVSERAVGIVLIGIGLWGFRQALTKTIHTHTHSHDGSEHTHIHAHRPLGAHDRPAAHQHIHAAFWVGIVHGLAGSSHLLGVLPALALPTRAEAVVYLTSFGMGTIAAMSLFAGVVGVVARRFEHQRANWYRSFLMGVSGAAVGIGGFWLWV